MRGNELAVAAQKCGELTERRRDRALQLSLDHPGEDRRGAGRGDCRDQRRPVEDGRRDEIAQLHAISDIGEHARLLRQRMETQVGLVVLRRAIGDRRALEVGGLGRAGKTGQSLMMAEIAELVGQLGGEQLHPGPGAQRHLRTPCGKCSSASDNDSLAANVEKDRQVIQSLHL